MNVTLDEILLGEVDRAAAAEQMNRSNFLARAARAFLDRRDGDATATEVALRKALCDSRAIHPSHPPRQALRVGGGRRTGLSGQCDVRGSS